MQDQLTVSQHANVDALVKQANWFGKYFERQFKRIVKVPHNDR